MGGSSAKQFTGDHILHYYSFLNNRLYVYFPEKDKFYNFEVYNKSAKFTFVGQETISLPSGSIYIIGGQVMNTEAPEEDEEKKTPDDFLKDLQMTDFVAKINLNKQENNKIDLDRSKPCRCLPEPRTSHLLIYAKPHIYVIGGYLEGNIGTNTCLRFHTANKDWESIADIPVVGYMKEPCGIAINDANIYVFETKLNRKIPLVHKYSVHRDEWVNIDVQEKTKGITIPPCFNCSVFQIDHNEVLILGGVMADTKQKNFYYKFDLKNETFTDPVDDHSRDVWSKERQGNLDYSNTQKVFTRLGDGVIKFFVKKDRAWKIDDLEPDTITNEGNWCTTGR